MAEADPISDADLSFLREAALYLERPRFLMKVANLVGKPAAGLLHALPERAQTVVGDVTTAAIQRALDWALRTLPQQGSPAASPRSLPGGERLHTALAATTGAIGGFFGLAGAAVEIPATTTLMLRSIAEIAAREGADLSDPATRLQCLAVFSYGSPTLETMESAYFSSRLAMAMATRDAAAYISRHAVQDIGNAISQHSAPALVRFINQIAARFQVVITEKLAAQAVPIAGAAMGSLVNAAFMDHFNRVAAFHFGIARLERVYGPDTVRQAYDRAAERPTRASR